MRMCAAHLPSSWYCPRPCPCTCPDPLVWEPGLLAPEAGEPCCDRGCARSTPGTPPIAPGACLRFGELNPVPRWAAAATAAPNPGGGMSRWGAPGPSLSGLEGELWDWGPLPITALFCLCREGTAMLGGMGFCCGCAMGVPRL